MTRGVPQDHQNLDRQIGCMAGFLQIFDRHQIINAKRLYSAKRLSHSLDVESDSAIGSPVVNGRSAPSPELRSPSPAKEASQPVSPLPLPVFEFKEGTRTSWKFSREAPRLSLDSRATVDAKGSLYPREIRTNAAILSANRRCESSVSAGDDDCEKNRRSPSVIARLMGLEPIRQEQSGSDPEPGKVSELRRSASESRVSKDLYNYRFVDVKQSQPQQSNARDSAKSNVRAEQSPKAQPHRALGQRKSHFDSADFFPEPNKQTAKPISVTEIERRLRMRGIDETSKDLETLKQILEALQLKGLLHPNKPSPQIDYRNFVYDNRNQYSLDESPIVVMRPTARPSAPPPTVRSPRLGNESPTAQGLRSRSTSRPRPTERLQSVSPCRERGSRTQSPIRNTRNESPVRSPNRRRPLTIETPRRGNEAAEHRRVSPVSSPKLNSRNQQSANRSPRSRGQPAARKEEREDASSTMSESTSTDTERAKMEESKEGKTLLERCDKLLNSIAEITVPELQPSPNSVLDSSFYKDESSTSPIMKRSIDFKDQANDLDDEIWVTALSSPIGSEISDGSSGDCDLIYVSEIVKALNYFPDDSESDVFQLLEKQRRVNGKESATTKVSKLRRRLIFDTIREILSQYSRLPPWTPSSPVAGRALLSHIWSEFRRIREREESEDLFEVICGVLRKDLNGDAAKQWSGFPGEVSDAVLDVERLIFKDLIGETIRDLATGSPAECFNTSPSRRKLVF